MELTDTQYIHIRELIRATLKSDTCKVVFIKADGTERIIRCTLDFDIIPEEHHPQTNQEQIIESNDKLKRTAIRVFDVDSLGWRSFKPETVVSINGIKTKDLGIF
ncbi:TPA: SH3 beta-barrel fold-containing protein [Vibrio cholerae]